MTPLDLMPSYCHEGLARQITRWTLFISVSSRRVKQIEHPSSIVSLKVSFTEFYEMVTGGNSPPPGLGGTGGGATVGGGGTAGGNALTTTAPLGQNVVQQRNKKRQVRGATHWQFHLTPYVLK